MKKTEYKKLLQSLRYWILGVAETKPEYYLVLQALNVAEKYHTGRRKNDEHEFSHQITIISYLKTLHLYFKDPISVFIVAILHDTIEDYPESADEIKLLFEKQFDMIMRISKIRNGIKIPYEQYFSEMQNCEVCSIVKLVDRMANISTMFNAFSLEKQRSYVDELSLWFLPMLKFSKRKFSM